MADASAALREADVLAGADAQLQAIVAHFQAEARRVGRRSDAGGKRAAVVMNEIADEIRRLPLIDPAEALR